MNDQPVARCSNCKRLTWDEAMIGQTCYAPRREEGACPGRFNPLPTPEAFDRYDAADWANYCQG